MIEYRGEIIETLGKGYCWNGWAYPDLEVCKMAIDYFIESENKKP